MPDFGVRFPGTAVESWNDPPGVRDAPLDGTPSRINAVPHLPLKRRLALTSDPVEIRAVVAGVEGPLDAALGGRLFYGWWIEYPTTPPLMIFAPAQSSVLTFTPAVPGHYTYMLRRLGGGGLILHVDAVDFGGG